jgi:signal transduction histidine kinase
MQTIPQYVLLSLAILIVVVIYLSFRLYRATKTLSLLRKTSEAQNHSQQERDDYLAILGHELRSPLSIMKGASDLILKDAHNLNKNQIEILLTQIRSSSSDMLTIVNNILDISKIVSGNFTVSKSFGNVNKTIKDECDYFVTIAGVRNIGIDLHLDDTLPSFNFDTDRMKQVVNNLLSNAINFIKYDGRIIVSSKKNQTFVEVSVSDTGDGILDDMKPKLFQKFVQKGTGLNLVIVKGIVEAHGGKIRVEDNTNSKGAKFIFTLPLS